MKSGMIAAKDEKPIPSPKNPPSNMLMVKLNRKCFWMYASMEGAMLKIVSLDNLSSLRLQ
jgi:hypothetical protein